jgi:Flp pilus assembly protein TadG
MEYRGRSRRLLGSTPAHGLPHQGRGQALVEFALVVPIFLILFIGIIEFAFVFSAALGLNNATRSASLVAAEAGNTSGADCAILNSIQQSIRSPMVLLPGDSVTIAQADRNGKPIAGRQDVWNYTAAAQPCTSATRTYSVNFTQASATYPATGSENSGGRCDILQGCSATVPLDSVAVSITYHYNYHTPLGNFLALHGWGSGFDLTWSNVMRLEPIL